MMVCKLHPERELLPFPFLLAHMWPCEHCSQKYYSLLCCSHTDTHTVLLTLSWSFLNVFPFKQASRQTKTCRLQEKGALYLRVSMSLCRANTHCIVCLTLQPFGCSSWVSLPPKTRCDYSRIPPSLQTLRTPYFCLAAQWITLSPAPCASAVLLSLTT